MSRILEKLGHLQSKLPADTLKILPAAKHLEEALEAEKKNQKTRTAEFFKVSFLVFSFIGIAGYAAHSYLKSQKPSSLPSQSANVEMEKVSQWNDEKQFAKIVNEQKDGNFPISQESTLLDIAKRSPDQLRVSLALALHYKKNGRLFEAEDLLKEVIALDSTDAAVWNNFGMLQLESKKYQDAIESFLKSLNIESDSKVQLNLARAFESSGQFRKAHEVLREVLMRGKLQLSQREALLKRSRLLSSLSYLQPEAETAQIKLRSPAQLLPAKAGGK